MNIRLNNLDENSWDEMYYILNNRKKLFAKNIKIIKQTEKYKKNIYLLISIMIALIIVATIRCINNYNSELTIVIGGFILTCIINEILNNIMKIIYTRKDIKERINKKVDRNSLKINREGVMIVQGKKELYKLPWKEINCILINKYTIVFLNSDKDEESIVVPIEIKKRVLTKLKQERKLDLVEDNTKFYEQEEIKRKEHDEKINKVTKHITKKKVLATIIVMAIIFIIWMIVSLVRSSHYMVLKDLKYGGSFSPKTTLTWGKISLGKNYKGEYDSNVHSIPKDKHNCTFNIIYYEENKNFTIEKLKKEETKSKKINDYKWYTNKDNNDLFTKHKKYIYRIKLDEDKRCKETNKEIIESLKFIR